MLQLKTAALVALFAASASPEGVLAFGIAGNRPGIQIRSTSFVPQSTRQQVKSAPLSFYSRRSPIALATSRRSSTQRGGATLTMFGGTSGGMEEMKEMTKTDNSLSKTVRKSPSLWKLAGYASIPVSAVLGFVMTPSRRFAAHTVGSVVTGAIGAVGKSRLDAATEAAAKPAIAQVILDEGLDSPVIAERIRDVQEVYGILDEDFEDMRTEVYKRYLLGMVRNPYAKTAELSELDKLKKALGMTNLMVGEAHAAAAREFYRNTCLFTPPEDLDDPDHPDRVALDKFLFLSERAFRQNGETDEAFKYEMSRIAKAFELSSVNEALDRVASVAEPFYRRALTSTRAKLETGEIKPDMLRRARNTVGISEQSARDMHIAAFNEEVRELLGKKPEIENEEEAEEEEEEIDMASLKFPEGALERLDKLRDVLGLTETDAEYEMTVEVTPLFQAVALSSMNDSIAGTKSPDKAWADMTKRQHELLLKDSSMHDLVASIISQALGNRLVETMNFAKVNNEAATYNHLLDLLDAKIACMEVVKHSGWEDFAEEFDKKFFDPRNKNSAAGFLDYGARQKLYRIFVSRCARSIGPEKELTDEMYEKMMQLKSMLAISDRDVEEVSREVFGPELQKVLKLAATEIMGDDYTPELVTNLQKMVDDVIDKYMLSKNLVREYGAGLYESAVYDVNDQSPGGIPSEEKVQALESLRELLMLKKEETYDLHVRTFGSVYQRSILEAMGSTGVIPPDYRAPLEDLRERLGVSNESARELFYDAVSEKMVPMIERISEEMERQVLTQQQLSRKRGKDYGEDVFKSGKGADGVLGIGTDGNIMSDIMNLIDFYKENDVIEKNQTDTKTVEKKVKEGDEEKTVTEEVPEYELKYPVTALGKDAIEPEMAELLYRQFVVGGFTAPNPQQASRYEAAKATWGGILGLSEEKMEEIGNNIGSMVYDNYITNSMKTKGSLDQQDMMWLANIQGKLGLTSEQSEKMLLDSQKKILSEEINSVMSDPSPEKLKAFREKCNSMGLDLEKDVGISKARLVRMFEIEISPGLDSGEITADSSDVLVEIQESLGLEPDDAEKVFEGLIDKRSKSTIETVKSELLRGREENCVDLIKRLVRFAAFVDGELDLDVPEATGYQIFNLYEAMDFSEEEPDTVEANKALLKTALKIS